jgi:hypothetical protein
VLIGGAEAASIELPAPTELPTTEVVSIYPSAQKVPLNLLRIYVSFSATMREGCAARVGFRRADTGEPLEGVFLPMDPELWDSSRQRLTLLLDPGRIKRGLMPNAEAGYPLAEDVPVSVVVDASFRDASGLPLRVEAQRAYGVGPAIRSRVDPHSWRLAFPEADSAAALVAVFDRPLDWALLRRCLVVVDAATSAVPGVASVDEGEQAWRFTPASAWRAGSYALRVDGRLEDVAGNSVRRVFDRDLDLPEDEPLHLEWVDIPFTVA